MFKFSQVATLEKNKLSTDAPFLILVEVRNSQLEEPIRLVRNTEDVKWSGSLWTAFPLSIDTYSEDGQTIPSVKLQISAGKGIVVTYLQKFGGLTDSIVNLYVVNSKMLEVAVPEIELCFQVTATEYDENWITFTLGPSPELASRFPQWRYIPDFCPFVIGDVRCGYKGEGQCQNDLASCLIPDRFGGEPGIQNRGY